MRRCQGPEEGAGRAEARGPVLRLREGIDAGRRPAEVRRQVAGAQGAVPERIRAVRRIVRLSHDDDGPTRRAGPYVRKDSAHVGPTSGTAGQRQDGRGGQGGRFERLPLRADAERRRDDRHVRRVQVPGHSQGLPRLVQVAPLHHTAGRHRAPHRLRPHRTTVLQHGPSGPPRPAQEGPPRRRTPSPRHRHHLRPAPARRPGPRPGILPLPIREFVGRTESDRGGAEGRRARVRARRDGDRQEHQGARGHQESADDRGDGEADGKGRRGGGRQHVLGVSAHGRTVIVEWAAARIGLEDEGTLGVSMRRRGVFR
mmetsp:Transcript_17576/g.32665  ORF Transcript_17576/g.32665 Transcript_17576/m.32665 type:complete len:313 (+) Transcript_17576:721-1659(+)